MYKFDSNPTVRRRNPRIFVREKGNIPVTNIEIDDLPMRRTDSSSGRDPGYRMHVQRAERATAG